jgi:hypothetical protein
LDVQNSIKAAMLISSRKEIKQPLKHILLWRHFTSIKVSHQNLRASSTWQQNTKIFGPLNALNNETEVAWKSAPSEDSELKNRWKAKFTIHTFAIKLQKQMEGKIY